MKVVIAAAGTAGHINPGLSIAKKIMEEERESTIIFIGTLNGLENDLVPRAGYELKTIQAHGLSKNIKKLFQTAKGVGQAKKILREFKPDVVIGTGGYICGPVILAARKLNIPCMLHESNSFPGLAIKMLSKKVDTTLVAFEEAKKRLPKAKNVVLTGTPTKIKKIDISEEKKEEIKKTLELKKDTPIILVFGGSQGARRINQALLEIIFEKRNQGYQIVWAPRHKTI